MFEIDDENWIYRVCHIVHFSLWSIRFGRLFTLAVSRSLRAILLISKSKTKPNYSNNNINERNGRKQNCSVFIFKWISCDSGGDDCVNALMTQCFIRSTRPDWQTNWPHCMWHWHEISHFQRVQRLHRLDRHNTVLEVQHTLCPKPNRSKLKTKLNHVSYIFCMHKTFLGSFQPLHSGYAKP